MGDGGVACMPLQQHIMKRFPIADKALCGGSNGNGNSTSNGLNSKSIKLPDTQPKKKIIKKIKRLVPVKKGVLKKSELATGKEESTKKEVEGSLNSVDKAQKEDVEEGELGTLKWPDNGQLVLDKVVRSSEIEKGEIVGDKGGKGGEGEKPEKGEIVAGKWRKGGDLEKGDVVLEKDRKADPQKAEMTNWKVAKDEIEKGEFIPDRWHKGDLAREEYSYGRSRRFDASREHTPPSGKYSSEDIYRRKELNRSGSQHSRSSYKWESGQEKNTRLSSKIVDEDGPYKNEYSNGKNHGREYSSSNRLKRYGIDSDISDRRHYGDYEDYTGSKSRRLSDDCSRSSHSDHYSRHSVERFYRNSSSSKIASLDKLLSRHHDSSSSRVFYDRHGRSPGRSERSPHDRARHDDNLERSPVRRERSPYGRDRSPYGRERLPYGRKRSPYGHEKSPYDRSRHYDHRNRSPARSERSPHDRGRYHDRRDRTPSFMAKSPLNYNRPNNCREANRKSGASEKLNLQKSNKEQEDKLTESYHSGRDLQISAKESHDRSRVRSFDGLDEKKENSESHKEKESQSPSICEESTNVNGGPHEELLSMEEDMDICDTPPHVSLVPDSSKGKWIYLDYLGVQCGPSKLCELKQLVEEGLLVSDHLIKHLDSDRWVTVENAVSPIVTVNFSSVVSDTITQLVRPPEAPGNLLADTGDAGKSGVHCGEEAAVTLPQLSINPDDNSAAHESLEDLRIDERVGALVGGITVIPGRELETVEEALQVTFDRAQWEGWYNSEGLISRQSINGEQYNQKSDEALRYLNVKTKEAAELRLTDSSGKDFGFIGDELNEWFSGQWPCNGGDWRRNDEGTQDKFSRKKPVLNNGYPLCQMPKSGNEDPRWHQKDDLSYPCQSKKLDLPSWAFSGPEPAVPRGMKGTMLPVVRINSLVVKEQGSLVSEPRGKARGGKERYSSRSVRTFSTTIDVKRSLAEGDSQLKSLTNQESLALSKSDTSINTPKDRLCTVDDLQLHLGDWYYLDGAGHDQGPFSFSELQILVDEGTIQKYSSVHRKFDNICVPVTRAAKISEATVKIQQENVGPSADSSGPTKLHCAAPCESNTSSISFHNMHPQFIGYTRGKLHELVMKSYKSREFAAAINKVLDPWLSATLPKKETGNHIYRKSEIDQRGGKRARLQVDESDEDYEMEEDLQTGQKDETTFDDLCSGSTFCREKSSCSEAETGSWGLLDGYVLARVFHFLRFDMKSVTLASLTCKHWRAAAKFYRGISRQVDVSSVGASCTDSIIWNIMSGYNKERIHTMVLNGCTNITSGMLEDILCSFPCLSSIDVRGCGQFEEMALKFPDVNWLKNRTLHGSKVPEELNLKTRNLKQITEKTPSLYRPRALGNRMDDFGELKDYFDSVDKRDSANQLFRRSLYKRSKLFDARRSSAILSRDARIRQWAIKKSESSYKRTEGFLASSLKDIMKENTFEFFVPKVAEIEDRMKNGYYITHGLSAVKEDISRMCRDAIKAKSRGAGNMNRITTLFLKLATRLEQSSRFSYERDQMIKSWKDDLSAGSGSTSSKYKKRLDKLVADRKYRTNGSNLSNGGFDVGEYASDREIRRRLSKLNRKSLDSGSETSDDLDRSSEDGKSDSENTNSDTESDLDLRSESQAGESRADGYLTADDRFDPLTDEREWGARMTKASLVPPVTRKYEVIDQYVIVADEEEVRRKMSVSLPEDYAEKLDAQKNGLEELDMELPEVKDYKPRKQLGDEVIEQEVYGIDPYTHNLLLDSMPEDLHWPLPEKQLFIEDVLLRTLNRQARKFTGTGNTPMIYPLRPIIEEIEKTAGDCDMRMVKMCHGILKAIDSRPDDKYVAYRKGLGVVCDKEGGFGEYDFVVEFLGEVYPAWKWFEKQDGIRSLQKDNKDAPEFYNIYLERPKGDADGYDLVVVDAMHKANYASRICHSCRPNCEAKVTAVDGQYQIGIYTVREIRYGEEVTFDYNSVTESKEEYEASVCLCGSQVCRGSYLNLTGEGAFQKVLKEWHGILNRYQLMLEACELNSVSEEDYLDLGRAGLGSCLLGGLPDWVVAFSARLVRFINLERTKLPEEILRHNIAEKRKYFTEICLEVEKSDAEVQAEGVYNQRLQNLAVTLDKVRYVMRRVFGDPKKAPPPLEKLSPEEAVSFLWNGEGSLVEQLLQCMAPHVEEDILKDLKLKIHAHDPSGSNDIQIGLQKSLLWLRDAVRDLPCTYKSRHDAAADLIHIYAYTKCFFRVREYKAVTSEPVYISPLDLGPKYADKLGAGLHEFCKTYGENYCLGQLIFWHIQTNSEPDNSFLRASQGCMSLPEIGSFYAKVQKPSPQRVYGPKTVKFMLARMEKQPQRPWPKDRIWSFNNSQKVFGSPMLDAVLNNTSLDREMVQWLRHRPAVFQATWDR
ncbi:SET domain protein 2 isoform 1 [Tripterygium wilfordii]|uniref:SET domain protein 2 isoform 1 n=1 Tax=Tripterygium wilfordii TaxID=458696 RepID=A0A7J7DI52_TRIWF|nr:histone-lysine N-methyltransferase ATXR3-like [Tripterygium wilfordii]KAF5746032.1 SET domain protein 2 isoform 1 [Tripterygium wilfordii]